MVQKAKKPAMNRLGLRLIGILALGMVLIIPKAVSAQDDNAGFGLHLSWTQYTEISGNRNDVKVSQQIAQIAYRDPQAFRLSFGLGLEEIDDLPEYGGEIDDALCFQATGAFYLAPNLEFGIPADLSLTAEYSRARHDAGDDKLTHQRIIATATMEWDFPPATPYIRVGALYASLDSPDKDEDNTSALFIGGVRFSLAQRLSLGAEFNISQDIGFGALLGYSF
ncbi:MAG: hypothetical protein AB1847_01530 [bacterium]